jgi:2-furoyl-CoA dehydrogenase large subunit
LLDPDKLAAVIPGCHSLDKVGDDSYRAEVSLGVGVVRGRFRASVDMSDMDPPNFVRLSGGVQGPLGASKGAGNVWLKAVEGGTFVTYDYEVEISGKVAAVGGRMLEGASRIVIGQFFERLVSQVGGKVPSPTGETLWQRILRAFGIER